MTADQSTGPAESEASRVVGWRLEQLRLSGFSDEQSVRLAWDREVDLHRCLALVKAGCPHELAVRIVS